MGFLSNIGKIPKTSVKYEDTTDQDKTILLSSSNLFVKLVRHKTNFWARAHINLARMQGLVWGVLLN